MAATKLWLARTGTLQHENRTEFYDKTVDMYVKREEQIPMQMGQYFSEEQTDSLTPKIQSYGTALSNPIEYNDVSAMPMDEPASGYPASFEIGTYAKGVIITDTLVKIDRSGGKVRDLLSGIAPSMKRMLELAMANVLNTGVSTEGADGSYLFAQDHYQPDPSVGVWSNLETGADLATTSLSTMRTNLRKRKNEVGAVQPIRLVKVLVPADLQKKAEEMAKSEKTPENAMNASNVFQGFTFDVVDWLTDTNAWAGWGDLPEGRWGLHLFFLTRPEVGSLDFQGSGRPKIKAGYYGYCQYACGASIVENMQWNSGPS